MRGISRASGSRFRRMRYRRRSCVGGASVVPVARRTGARFGLSMLSMTVPPFREERRSTAVTASTRLCAEVRLARIPDPAGARKLVGEMSRRLHVVALARDEVAAILLEVGEALRHLERHEVGINDGNL